MKQLVCLLTLAATFWLVLPSDGIEVRSLYSNVILDEKNLHRNIISLNLLPKRLPIDKLTLLETQLKLQLSTKLWSPRAEVIGTEDLALYIQALHASCFNPFDFYGVNLVQMLTNYTSQPEKYKVTSFEDHLTTLTLCLLSKNASHFTSLLGSAEKLDRLLGRHNGPIDSLQYLRPFPARNASNLLPDPMSTSDLLMKSLAVSCYARHVPHDRNIRFELNDLMASVFMTQNITDGSFNGSITTTSLAVQAFIESGLDRLSFLWDRRKAVNFIMNSVHGRDVNATLAYFMVPAFHRTWHEIQCWNKSNSFNHVDTEDEYVRTWTRALNQVLNQADSSVNVTVSRWVYGSSGEKTKVSVNIPPESSLLRALKESVKSSTTYHYDAALQNSTKNQTVRLLHPLLQKMAGEPMVTTPATDEPGTRRSIAHWIRALLG